jgi:hypothetical protein
MKWIMLLLLTVNIAVGGFQYWQSIQPAAQTSIIEITKFNNLELTQNQAVRLEKASERAPALAEKPSSKCIKIVGLAAEDGLPIVQSRLKALEINPSQIKETVVLRTDYQVIVGPFASNNLARTELQSIAGKGVESYVITAGKNENALSLGVFSSESNANRKVAELSGLDIASNIVSKEHLGDAYSLVITRESASLISDSTLTSILSNFKNAKFSRYTCN